MADHHNPASDRATAAIPPRTNTPSEAGSLAPLHTAADYRDLIESLDAIVWEADPEGRFTFVSQRAESILGFPVARWLETPDMLTMQLHPDDRDRTLQAARDAIDRGVDYSIEHRAFAADGRVVWLRTVVRAVKDANGVVSRLRGLTLDITGRKNTERALQLTEERYRDLVENLTDVIFSVDSNGLVTYISPAFEALAGYPPEAVIGRPLTDFMHPADLRVVMMEFALAKSGATALLEYRLVGRSGELRWVCSHIRPMLSDGRFIGFQGVLTDITNRKRAEHELHDLNLQLEERVKSRTAQLEAINRELEAFSYSVSHDLRAPLRAINGFSELLLEDYHDHLDAEGQELLQRVLKASRRMSQLIDAMLELSRLTRTDMHHETIDLTGLARGIAAELQEGEPTRQVRFNIHDGLTAEGDARLLRIVLENLLGNAWKFTSKHPQASIDFVAVTTDDGTRAFCVRDDGAGFNMKMADKLFGAFQRIHPAQDFEGTGIGLATVQRIIHRHGGRTWAEGAVEQGASFYFTLPANGKREG